MLPLRPVLRGRARKNHILALTHSTDKDEGVRCCILPVLLTYTSCYPHSHISRTSKATPFLLFLRCNQRTTENHHACTKQPFTQMTFAK